MTEVTCRATIYRLSHRIRCRDVEMDYVQVVRNNSYHQAYASDGRMPRGGYTNDQTAVTSVQTNGDAEHCLRVMLAAAEIVGPKSPTTCDSPGARAKVGGAPRPIRFGMRNTTQFDEARATRYRRPPAGLRGPRLVDPKP